MKKNIENEKRKIRNMEQKIKEFKDENSHKLFWMDEIPNYDKMED